MAPSGTAYYRMTECRLNVRASPIGSTVRSYFVDDIGSSVVLAVS